MTLRKIAGYALGPVGGAALGLVSLPLMSWYFSAEDIGRMILLQTAAALLLIISGLGSDQAYIREYHNAADKASLLKSLAAVPLLLVVLMLLLAAGTAAPQLAMLLFGLPDFGLGIMLIVFFALVLPMRYGGLILRMQEKAWLFSVSQLLPKLLLLLLTAFCLLAGIRADTSVLMALLLAAQISGAAVLLYQTRRETAAALASSWQRAVFADGIRYGIPLVFSYLAYWGFTSADRFALQHFGSLAELGIYSMAVSVGAVALVFQSVFSTIWAPMVFEWVEKGIHLDKISPVALDMTRLITALVCITGLLSPLAAWVLPPQYADVQFILLCCMLFPLFYTLTEASGIGLNVVRRTGLLSLVSLAALVCNGLLLAWLVPAWGAKGAAVSTAVSFWLFSVLRTELSSRLWQNLPRRKIYTHTLFCLLLCLSYTIWGTPENYPLFALIWLAVLSALYLANRRRLSALTAELKGRLQNR
ncbi:lipopolysaccharide biosynthesis protein [Neisseria animalis]|uniref:Lipopolysaccharide biosynthesis protein n=1 Tax=Neisseria animalis TaxID=492 RepID=A0A5P3MTT6_NEIAN|nr:lipopolysaccharide biosynthesis protein [Neisseria animalis]ROW32907.1 lipopolysaccharide biosynthesis protein [Neisseria animalis]